MNLKVVNLNKSFGKKAVLKDISIEINNFHSLSVIGPSGSGKSTFLRILAGLTEPESGEIFINGEELKFNDKYLSDYRKTIGVVFQSYNLFPHLTALDNIVLPLTKVHNLKREEAVEIAFDYLSRFQLSEHMDKKPIELSGGQQQRVSIARALALGSKFILLDEPTSALDPEMTSEVLTMLRELKEQNKDFIVVTHEMGFARQSCDYVIYMDKETILEHGRTSEIFQNPKSCDLKNFLDKILEWR